MWVSRSVNHHIGTRISQVSTRSPTWCRLPPHRPSQCARYSSPSSHRSFQTMVTNDAIAHVSCQKYIRPLVAGDSSRDPTWSLIVGGHLTFQRVMKGHLTIPKQGKKNCHVGPFFEVQIILSHTQVKMPYGFFHLEGVGSWSRSTTLYIFHTRVRPRLLRWMSTE